MAIFYNHIKGCGSGATGVSGSKTDLWTWIKWANIADNSSLSTTASVNELPSIWLNKSNTDPSTGGTDAGKIITSKASDQLIEQFFVLSAGAKIGFGSHFLQSTAKKGTGSTDYALETNADLWLSNTSLILANNSEKNGSFNDYSEPFANIFFLKTEGGVLDKQNTNVLKVIANASATKDKQGQTLFQALRHTFDGHIWAQKSLYVGGGSVKTEDSSLGEGVIKATQRCEALYFNATSDSRAKSNIKSAEFSALDIVKQLPVYTFNYLNDPKLSVGLIAQEAAEYDLDGFNMVDNLDASGEFGDFMQMKESKLVYVLWKAVQELSAEVEDLKSQIHNLK